MSVWVLYGMLASCASTPRGVPAQPAGQVPADKACATGLAFWLMLCLSGCCLGSLQAALQCSDVPGTPACMDLGDGCKDSQHCACVLDMLAGINVDLGESQLGCCACLQVGRLLHGHWADGGGASCAACQCAHQQQVSTVLHKQSIARDGHRQ
jgi:hypothetical protein